MNELIEHFAERATKEMDQEAFSEDMNIPVEWYHKFAELIVQECIGAISEVKERFFKFRLETDDFTEKNRFCAGEDACKQSVRKIETLFGVEE